MERSTTRSKRSTLRSSSGVTVAELLLALAISMAVVGSAFAITMSSRRLMQADQTRTGANQSLRSAMDIIGNDVRLAGERLSRQGTPDIPPVVLVGGNDLALRRNVLENSLPVCNSASTATGPLVVPLTAGKILVSRKGAKKDPERTQCDNDGPRDKDSDGIPDDLEAWKLYREENDDDRPVRAYAFSGGPDGGEFFIYSGELDESAGYYVANASGTWQKSYSATGLASVYLLDERRYRLNGTTLELILNDDTANPLNILRGVSDFQVRVLMQDTTRKTDLTLAEDWQKIQAVQVSLTVGERVLTSEYFPRNILSK